MSSSTSRDVDATSASPHVCQNCGAALHGPYCSHCGQHDIDYHRSFHHVAHDLLENVFHFEGKFFSSVALLLAKPGQLTREFIAGRRQSQLNPLRFYLFVSVLFFLVVTFLNHGHLVNVDEQALIHLDPTAPASASASAKAPAPRDNFDARLERKFKSGELNAVQIVHELEHRVPTLFFLGVPLFALLLRLLYLGSGRYYVEHLIFSLHLHTWAFLASLLGDGYGQLFALGPRWLAGGFRFAFGVWLVAYLLASFHTVYRQSWKKSALKAAAATLAYAFSLAFVAAGLALATVFWLALD
ncbi:DUF3667 domain-containing protein [Horticoccus luteus]|uniref:DUF3667 domain-containing protein n=1 Tax=Horticoccus luteus TaxID=2862869 RepID=A0A8F9TWC7_9BACT|nr:DUF3667 domain-containing protein [Horticoccus luteus]QYM79513.1 DUF3667 domain-containing protein [Horticoccus luteus]